MSVFSDPILFFVNLALNLLLFGCLIFAAVVVSFRLIKNVNPRLRYVIATTAFLVAALAPIAVTFNASIYLSEIIEAKNNRHIGSGANFSEQNFIVEPDVKLLSPQPEPEKKLETFLNDFAVLVADSSAGKILFSLWVLGAFGSAFRDILALWRLKKTRRLWREATDSEREELGVFDNTQLYFGEDSPATVGFFHPVIVLPKNFPGDLLLAQKRYIVRHEMSHARWRDPLVNFILHLDRAAFWISPALWLLEQIVVSERESAADRAAVTGCSSDESEQKEAVVNYAATLIAVAKHFNFHAARGSFGASNIGLYNGSILEKRIRRLLEYSSKTTSFSVVSAAAILAGSFAGLLFMPAAFQTEAADLEAQAKEYIQKENSNVVQADNLQDKSPQIFAGVDETKTETFSSDQVKKTPPRLISATVKNRFQIPYVVMVKRASAGSADDDKKNNSEDSMRKISEEDAKAAGMEQKLDDLSRRVQGLDAARKNLGSNILQVRQKAAAQIDSLMRQSLSDKDSDQKPN